MKKKVIVSVISAVLILLVIGGFVFADLASFPGEIKTPDYAKQVVTDGVKSTFHDGVIYRYPGQIPLLEVSGDHYEMGLQYGVLLRPELLNVLPRDLKVLEWASESLGVPEPLLAAVMKLRARDFVKRVPQRYQDEMRGIADGSGLPFDDIIATTLFWDISQSGCTGILMRGPGGTIIGGKNDDSGSLGSVAGSSIMVRARAKGYNTVTQIVASPSGMMGFMGCNDKGLTYTVQTLVPKNTNPKGYPVDIFIRTALEECSSLEQVYKMLDQYPASLGGFGIAWSDQKTGRGVVTELTPSGWGKVEMNGPILWDENRYYNPEMAKKQNAATNLSNHNTSRDDVASTFPVKAEYTVEDAINFLRLQTGPDGSDYSWNGTKSAICDYQGTQTVVFDPKGDGYYVAFGPYYSARQDVYHIFNDFSKQPELFMKAIPIKPVIADTATVYMKLENRNKKLVELVELAGKYPDDANMQFVAGFHAYLLSKTDLFMQYCEKAYSMSPQVAEYKFFAGIAAYEKKDFDTAARLLESITEQDLKYPAEEVYRLTLLEKIYAAKDPSRAAACSRQKLALLDKYNAKSLAGDTKGVFLANW
jgi:tetratricopeptide (TPR) repeat protein